MARPIERQDVLGHCQQAVNEILGDEAPALREDLRLGEDIDFDSLDLIEMMMLVEEQLDVTIDAGDLEEARTVADLIDVVLRRIPAAS